MTTMHTLYNLLQVNRKITDVGLRFMYLKDIWGLEQQVIGDMDGVSQSFVSKKIIEARKQYTSESLAELSAIWEPDEIKYIHMLPREILPDIPAIAFINDILGVHPIHGFFDYMDTPVNARIVGLAWLGVQNKRLVELFKKNQPTVSMVVKRSIKRIADINRQNRYDATTEYKFRIIPAFKVSNKFIKAGGQEG